MSGQLFRIRHSNVTVWITMLVASVASLVAAFVLSIDALRLAEDPNADLGCNVNTVISCGTVASSWQSSVLGFPNAYLGLVTEPVVITLAVAALSWLLVEKPALGLKARTLGRRTLKTIEPAAP